MREFQVTNQVQETYSLMCTEYSIELVKAGASLIVLL